MMSINRWRTFTAAFGSAALTMLAFTPAASAHTPHVVPLKFINHIQAGLPEQDVFVGGVGLKPGRVVRVDVQDAKDPVNLAKPAYTSARIVPHDPFKVGKRPRGPFPQGRPLGLTLGQWLDATGSGTYVVRDDQAEINLSFQKLVPNAAYTVWCSRITFPPNPKVVDMPCGKPDGSENVLWSTAKGRGSLHLQLPALPSSTTHTATVIALAYHSDGKTYGPNPGDFGLNSHVQLFFLLPPAHPMKPTEGWMLHIDAEQHFAGTPKAIAHHYCKPVSGEVIECQLYDSDDPDARLVGTEVVTSAKAFQTLSKEEQKLWHYHKTEIPKVHAVLPDLSPEEAAKVVKSIENTYGKIFIFWNPQKTGLPTGQPTVTVLK